VFRSCVSPDLPLQTRQRCRFQQTLSKPPRESAARLDCLLGATIPPRPWERAPNYPHLAQPCPMEGTSAGPATSSRDKGASALALEEEEKEEG